MGKFADEGFTFDDVVLVPLSSDILPVDVDIKANLTKHIKLNIPIVSSAMDTVTTSAMAIAMSRQGGLGFIHKEFSIEEQASEVDKVKRSEHGVITDPFFLSPNHYVYEANELMAKYHISGVPITENGKLVGIITNRDIRFETDHNKKIYEVMTHEGLITAPEGTTLNEAKSILTKYKIEKLPIVDDRSRLKGLITIKDIEKSIKYPNSSKDELGRLIVGAAIDITDDVEERVAALVEAKVDVVLIDTALRQLTKTAETVRLIKNKFPKLQVTAGNAITKETAATLLDAGIDALKVGFGAGSVATTTVVTGVGFPQLKAILDCYEVAKSYGVPIISDGGIRFPGDITKAIAAGANTCMLGGLLVGCEESPGRVELFQGRKYKTYKGYNTNVNPGQQNTLFFQEGVEGRVACKGTVADAALQLVNGLRSGMSYCGLSTVEELQNKGTFCRITQASKIETHPHGVEVTKEAPNYSVEF